MTPKRTLQGSAGQIAGKAAMDEKQLYIHHKALASF
jgi:hypothetical protein